jgi:hypothetical protein
LQQRGTLRNPRSQTIATGRNATQGAVPLVAVGKVSQTIGADHGTRAPGAPPCCVNPLLLVIIILLLVGGGGFYLGGPAFGGGGIGLILLICLIVYLMGGFRGRK